MTLILAVLVVALVGLLVWERRHAISAWWAWLPYRPDRRKTPITENRLAGGDECEVCGHMGAENVTLGSVTARPEFGGSSGITATFCPEHLPPPRSLT